MHPMHPLDPPLFTVKVNNYNHTIFVRTNSKARGIGKKVVVASSMLHRHGHV